MRKKALQTENLSRKARSTADAIRRTWAHIFRIVQIVGLQLYGLTTHNARKKAMHLSVELKSAILYFIHTSSLLPGMPTEYRDPDKHLSRDDLRELMDNATMVYSLARHIFERWPTSPSLKLVPEPGRKRAKEDAESHGDQVSSLQSDPPAPTKPKRPRV